MKRSRRDFLDINRQIRKPMSPPTKVIPNQKDINKRDRFDWRKELEEQEDDYREGDKNEEGS